MNVKNIELLIEQIKAFCALLRRYRKGRWQITEFALFGSVPHNDFRLDSDVDVLVAFAPDASRTTNLVLQQGR